MVIVFDGGSRVLNQEAMEFLRPLEKPVSYVDKRARELSPDYEIYGDDLKIEVRSLGCGCAFRIKDYDEILELESEIGFVFDKNELNQLIAILNGIYDSL